MIKNKRCYFFVDDIKSSFVYNELLNVSAHFKEVIVISKAPIDFNNQNVTSVVLDYNSFKSLNNFFSNFFLILKVFIHDVNFSRPYFNIKFLSLKISTINRNVYLANQLRKITEQDPGAVYYSFWFNDWATVLGILKAQNKIAGFFTRVHGADLFEERVPVYKRLALRKFQLKHVDEVFSISRKGAEYLKKKYPSFKTKIFTSYLGTADNGIGMFDPLETFTIVSCAKIRNIKRIHLIPEILKHIDFPIRWIHIGDENLDSDDQTIPIYLKNKHALETKKNVDVVNLGHLSNEQVLKFYKENTVSLFISVSQTEGLPVSMMEAISFGIPILSTDVGGCNEIVNSDTGVLISKDFDPSEVASKIEKLRKSDLNSIEGREKIRMYWKKNFNNEFNFQRFLEVCFK